MAKIVDLSNEDASSTLSDMLFRAIQSSNLNFLLGAGASYPGLPIAGDIEVQIEGLLKEGKSKEADSAILDFLKKFQSPMEELLRDQPSSDVKISLDSYVKFIRIVDSILSERKNNLLPKQASIFTTNYDLYIEKASELCPAILLNDGFNRVPNLKNEFKFAPERLFDATLHTGNHYDYTAELPSLNLVKLHGSMTWRKKESDIVYGVLDLPTLSNLDDKSESGLADFINELAIVLPTQRKFHQTIIERTYYDLLRIFANVLEKEGCLLISFGFSFRDEHIQEVVKRALRNPTLKLVVTCYSQDELPFLEDKFASYNNVSILIASDGSRVDFSKLNSVLSTIAPAKVAQ